MVEGGDKPKMASLLPGMLPESIDLATALVLLSLPKNIGKNPENSEDILIASGRFGPYVKCGSESRSIPVEESPFSVTIERALELLKQPRTSGRASNQPKTLKEVGKHPTSGDAIVIKSGRYGPYVTDGTTNASLTQGSDPESLTIVEAVGLLEARAAKGPAKGRRKRAPAKAKTKVKAPAKAKAATTKPTKAQPAKKRASPAKKQKVAPADTAEPTE